MRKRTNTAAAAAPAPDPDLGPAFTRDGTTYQLKPGVELDKLPKVHRTPVPGKPTLPPPPRPRNESAQQLLGRVHTVLDKATKHLFDRDLARVGQALGSDAGDGFIVRATDGYRALLVPGTPSGSKPTKIGALSDLPYHAILTPGFQLALKRVGTCADASKRIVQITVDAQKRRLRLAAWDTTVEGNEWVPTWGELTKAVLSVQWRYLEDALGVWPAFLYYSPKQDRIVVTDADDSFRYPLMQCRVK